MLIFMPAFWNKAQSLFLFSKTFCKFSKYALPNTNVSGNEHENKPIYFEKEEKKTYICCKPLGPNWHGNGAGMSWVRNKLST